MNDYQVNLDLLFETSWEVCNKIGGIYTVLSTKAKTLQSQVKDKTIFIGPDVWPDGNPSPYFKESRTLYRDWLASDSLPDDITVKVGRWEIPGKPIAMLVKFDTVNNIKDSVYGLMWQQFGVDSLHAYGDYDEGCIFAIAAAKVIESFIRYYHMEDKRVIAHFDEWTTGMGLLYLRHAMPSVATVFTTHATCIGRSICGNGKPLYDYLTGYNGDQMAQELNMESKHSLEKTAAHNADIFTTVSEITARECAQLLERNPEVTPNGFEQNFVPKGTAYTTARDTARSTILSRINTLTGQNLDDSTFIVATSGRMEYRNKGIDLMLEASARLREIPHNRKVLVLVMVPGWVKEPRPDLIQAVANAPLPDPVITHILNNPGEDPIINRIHQIGFSNDTNSTVSVVYVPCYLNGDDGIFNMSYYDLLPAMDATVFPSYYEPWGYTPLESIAFSVPTVTTSLSGFGQWIKSIDRNSFDASGTQVVERGDFNYDEVADKIAHLLAQLASTDNKTLEKYRKAAHATSRLAAWSHFIKYYIKAYDQALYNASCRLLD